MNFTRVDTFTTQVGQGNPAAIVVLNENAEYSDTHLAMIANDLNCEVGFIMNSGSYQHTGKLVMRFFTAAKVELKFIGHVTIAALVSLSHGRAMNLTVQCKGGNIPARVVNGKASFEIPAPSKMYEIPVPFEDLTNAIGDITLDTRIPVPMYVFGTSSRLVVFVQDLEQVKPDFSRIVDVSNFAKVSGVFVVELSRDGRSTKSRMFCPLIGIPEDSGSGNAHGLIGFILQEMGLLCTDNKFVGYQGACLGRPSIIHVNMVPETNTAEIGGHGVVFCTGRIENNRTCFTD
jgi:trans-2,3-dihydro-3-hydroxyanthranilate isomerase